MQNDTTYLLTYVGSQIGSIKRIKFSRAWLCIWRANSLQILMTFFWKKCFKSVFNFAFFPLNTYFCTWSPTLSSQLDIRHRSFPVLYVMGLPNLDVWQECWIIWSFLTIYKNNVYNNDIIPNTKLIRHAFFDEKYIPFTNNTFHHLTKHYITTSPEGKILNRDM